MRGLRRLKPYRTRRLNQKKIHHEPHEKHPPRASTASSVREGSDLKVKSSTLKVRIFDPEVKTPVFRLVLN
jgi:hypothetical protein